LVVRQFTTSHFAALEPQGKFFYNFKGYGNEENSNDRSRHHATDDGSPKDPARYRARACGGPQWHATEDESKGGHENRPKPDARACESGLLETLPALELLFREFDDQNCILCRQSDQHHQPDLSVDIVFEVSRPQSQIRSQHCDRRSEKHAERQRPAPVFSPKNQKPE